MVKCEGQEIPTHEIEGGPNRSYWVSISYSCYADLQGSYRVLYMHCLLQDTGMLLSLASILSG